jgi:mannose-1-phosphate guanylyltransferase/mannose-6-phosphate isomerase
MKIKPVILSGGRGSRLWPLSRQQYPKQYLPVGGEKTLFQQSVVRAGHWEDTLTPLIICNNDHRFLVAEQLQGCDMRGEIVLEPTGRGTAPAVAMAALLAEKDDPLLLIMPADHVIPGNGDFRQAVVNAAELAEQGFLVTFGVTPTSPETGYGYIKAAEPEGTGFRIESFVEKPGLETARSYLEQGTYYWNSGMFLFRASTFLDELGSHAPAMLTACRKAMQTRYEDLDFIRLDEETFAACPADSLDYAVMEKTERGAMVSLDTAWSDLGSWSSLYDAGTKDEQGNVIQGDVLTQDTSDSYLHAEKRLLAAVGLDNVIVIETPDAILVADKAKAQQVKEISSRLKRLKRPEADVHSKVYRPWGSFEGLVMDNRFQVKRLTVKPGQVLSLQKHHHRSEHWIVVSGTARVTNGDREFLLTEDQSTYIPLGNVHRLENPGKIPLEIIEIQTGAYLGEDDIVRLEDVYGRNSKS